jgi:hypothetical protein
LSLRSNLGLKLANAFGVKFKLRHHRAFLWLAFYGALWLYSGEFARLQVQTGTEHKASCSLLADCVGDYKFRI